MVRFFFASSLVLICLGAVSLDVTNAGNTVSKTETVHNNPDGSIRTTISYNPNPQVGDYGLAIDGEAHKHPISNGGANDEGLENMIMNDGEEDSISEVSQGVSGVMSFEQRTKQNPPYDRKLIGEEVVPAIKPPITNLEAISEDPRGEEFEQPASSSVSHPEVEDERKYIQGSTKLALKEEQPTGNQTPLHKAYETEIPEDQVFNEKSQEVGHEEPVLENLESLREINEHSEMVTKTPAPVERPGESPTVNTDSHLRGQQPSDMKQEMEKVSKTMESKSVNGVSKDAVKSDVANSSKILTKFFFPLIVVCGAYMIL